MTNIFFTKLQIYNIKTMLVHTCKLYYHSILRIRTENRVHIDENINNKSCSLYFVISTYS